MTEFNRLCEGAEEWFESAKAAQTAGHLYVAFESFRHATELACKAILLRATGSFPRDHAVAGPLVKHNLLPPGQASRSLQKFLSEFTLGTYGFERQIHDSDVQNAKRIAVRMMQALKD